MVLSDRHIREQLSSGGIVIDPLGEGCIQPSSVDLHTDQLFRVFRNDTTPFIDPKAAQEDLTELVEVDDGSAFILHPGEFVLGSTLERVALGNDLVARLEGKALAFDTRIPTPDGWKTMAGLEVGDEVFDPDGKPVPVVAATELMVDRPCRQVTFSDGTRVIADAEHQWEVQTKYDRKCGHVRVMTTDAIAESLRSSVKAAFQVPRARAMYPPRPQLHSRTRPCHPAPALAPTAATNRVEYSWSIGPSIAHSIPRREIDAGIHLGPWIAPRAITDIREVPSVPVRCIEVGSQRGAFLITTSFIPTHNSSLGRLGLLIHSTAGFVDAGWDGHLTLELSNVANLPIAIYPGMKIGQISFLQMSSEAENPYGGDATASKYKGQQGPTPSRYYLNFPEDERN